MIVYINQSDEILWLHEDNTAKEQYLEDDNCIVVDKQVLFLPEPDDDNFYVQKWNRETQEVYLQLIGPKPSKPITNEDLKADTRNINQTTLMTSEDALLIMDMLLTIQEQISSIATNK